MQKVLEVLALLYPTYRHLLLSSASCCSNLWNTIIFCIKLCEADRDHTCKQDLENTVGSWDLYGQQDEKRYPGIQAEFFERAAAPVTRRESAYALITGRESPSQLASTAHQLSLDPSSLPPKFVRSQISWVEFPLYRSAWVIVFQQKRCCPNEAAELAPCVGDLDCFFWQTQICSI